MLHHRCLIVFSICLRLSQQYLFNISIKTIYLNRRNVIVFAIMTWRDQLRMINRSKVAWMDDCQHWLWNMTVITKNNGKFGIVGSFRWKKYMLVFQNFTRLLLVNEIIVTVWFITQLTFTCLKSIIETLEKGVIYVQS